MRAYSSVYEAAGRINDSSTAQAALARAEQWLARYFAIADEPAWAMRFRRWLGLSRFLRYRRLWPA
ncbi:MAG: hypothetical protein SNJ67_04900 [Chloracidobacterium sp.]